MNRIYVLLAALAMIGTITGAAYLKGRADGKAVERAAQLEVIQELNDALEQKESELAALEAQRLEEMQALEEEVDELRRLGYEDPNATRPAVGLDSVRRLNSIN